MGKDAHGQTRECCIGSDKATPLYPFPFSLVETNSSFVTNQSIGFSDILILKIELNLWGWSDVHVADPGSPSQVLRCWCFPCESLQVFCDPVKLAEIFITSASVSRVGFKSHYVINTGFRGRLVEEMSVELNPM